MELLEHIKSRLSKVDVNQLAKPLGYNSPAKAHKRLNALISSGNVENWLRQGGYDFVHSNQSFLMKLCEVLDLDENLYLPVIDNIREKLKKLSAMPQPYIFVNTNFKRSSEPIFALAFMEGQRRIYIDKLAVLNSLDEGISIAVHLVTEHYKKSNGTLEMWGKIDNYVYHVNNKKYVLNHKGELLDSPHEIPESRASLFIGNREIGFLKSE